MVRAPTFDWFRRLPLARLFVVALTVYLAYTLGRRPSIVSLVLFLAAGAGVLLFTRPNLGFVILIIAAINLKLEIPTGTLTNPSLLFAIIPFLGLLWLLDCIQHGSFHLFPTVVNVPAILLVLCATLSLIGGLRPYTIFAETAPITAQLAGWAMSLISISLLLIVGNRLTDIRWLKWMVGLFLVIAVPVMLSRVFPILTLLITSKFYAEPGGTGSVFWVWIAALAGGMGLFNRGLPKKLRFVLVSMAVAVPIIGYFTLQTWVSGFLPPLVCLVCLLLLFNWRYGLVVLGLGLVYILTHFDIFTNLVALKAYSIDTRGAAWDIMLRYVIPMSPILGLGPANYTFYTPLFPILGYAVKFNSHNQYIDLIAQYGILGLLVFLWLMSSLAVVGLKLRNQVKDEFSRGYVFGCIAGLMGTVYCGLHGDWVLPYVYNIGLSGYRAAMLAWLFLGGLLAVQRMTIGDTTRSLKSGIVGS